MRYGALIILLSIFLNLPAQPPTNYTFRHIDQTDGLLHNDVYGICQDAKGFMWILTLNGLQRYDGTRFINYPGIVNKGRIQLDGLHADTKKNELWILKTDVIGKLDVASNRFRTYDAQQLIKDPAFTFDTFTSDEFNNRYLLGEKGAFVLPPAGNTISYFFMNIHPLTQHHDNTMATDSLRHQTLFVNGGGHLFLFDGSTRKVFSGKHNPLHHPLLQFFSSRNVNLRSVVMDSRSDYWISTWDTLFYRFNQQTGQVSSYSLSSIKKRNNTRNKAGAHLLINAIYEDNNANIWIATENAGLLLYHAATDDFEDITVDHKNGQGIDYNFTIYSITQDKEDNIWVGTDKGISIFNPYRQCFRSIRHEENKPSLPQNEIISFIQTNTGSILVGTWGGGIAVYDDQWHFKKNIVFPNHSFEYNMVWSFIEQDDGNIWAGCQHGYIHIYNPVTENVKTIHPAEFGGYTIRCMAKDAKGNIWFGLQNGKIVQWNKRQNKFYPFNDSVNTTTNNGAPVCNLFIDKAQRFWVSTANGFKEFDPDNMYYSSLFLPDKKNPHAISGISCQGIEACNDTTLLIGTTHGGLNFFNTTTKQFSQDSSHDVLRSGSIFALKKDTDGNIWFTADYSLYQFKPGNKKIIRYNMEPGVINSSFYATGFYTLRDGTWLTASATEVIYFQPKTPVQYNRNEKVEITGFKIFDHAIFIDSFLYQNKPVVLSYKQNFLTIEFALLNFYNLQQIKYQYRLSNVNADWVSTDTKKFASYTNLRPGEYIFSVKLENGMGVLQPTSFTIIILPPFWQTWWFRSMIGACILSLIYLFVKWREKNIKAIETEKRKVQQLSADRYKSKLEMEQILSKAKLEALRAQMNPHFIFNCLNSIDSLIQMDEKENATLYLSKFARLIRSVLENATNDVIPCWKDMETLQLYLELEALRFDNKFSYQVTIADEIMHGDYKVPPLVIQPFVENAIHHGLLNKIEPDKRLLVDVSVAINHIYYRIEDNGVGRAKAEAYKQLNKQLYESKGMQITSDRIDLFNQHTNGSVIITDLYDEQGSAAGTKVEVELINYS